MYLYQIADFYSNKAYQVLLREFLQKTLVKSPSKPDVVNPVQEDDDKNDKTANQYLTVDTEREQISAISS